MSRLESERMVGRHGAEQPPTASDATTPLERLRLRQ
jgi:hypothetical protein